MKQRSCKNCGAPLVGAEPGTVVTCEHCGSTLEVPVPRSGSAMLVPFIAMGALFAISGLGLVVGLLLVSPPESPQIPGLEGKQIPPDRLPVSRAGELNDMPGWTNLDSPGRVGEWTDFPLLDNLPWMQKTAEHWAADAALTRLIVDGVRSDGTLDLSSREDWGVDVRFASPTLRKTAVDMKKVSEEKVISEFRLDISEKQVKALVNEAHRAEEAVPEPLEVGCTLNELIANAVEAGLGQRPTYSANFYWTPSAKRWRVVVDSVESGDDIKSVTLNPATCHP